MRCFLLDQGNVLSRYIEPMLNVGDAGPTLNQNRFIDSFFLGNTNISATSFHIEINEK